jgi:hypothetical protein
LGSVGSIGRFPVIDGVGYLTILGEAGKPRRINAYKCVRRWWAKSRRVRIVRSGSPQTQK